jgi:sarcosine oxidase subunit beta
VGAVERVVGEDAEFITPGHIRVAFRPDDVARLEAHAAAVREYGLELEMISGNTLRARFPFLAGNILAGSFSPLDGHANPRLAAPAFGRAARRDGALVVENAEVLAVEKPGVDFVVETRGAGTYRAPLVMVSTGRGRIRYRRGSGSRCRWWRRGRRWG